MDREAVPAGFETFKLTLKGLKGGHSGGEIHVGLGNANKLLVRFLAGHAEELDLRLIDFNGGTLRNAIPREAFATIAVAADKVDALKSLVNTYQDILKNELAEKEKNLALLLDSVANDKAALIAKSRDNLYSSAERHPERCDPQFRRGKRCGRNLPERRCGDHD